jgi:hypothetical protein
MLNTYCSNSVRDCRMYSTKIILFIFGTAIYFDLYAMEVRHGMPSEIHSDLRGISSRLSEAASSGRSTDEERLLMNMLKLYNAAARPVYNASHAVTVQFGINLVQIQKMVSHQIT